MSRRRAQRIFYSSFKFPKKNYGAMKYLTPQGWKSVKSAPNQRPELKKELFTNAAHSPGHISV
jgi:hypothetical protein